MSAEWKPGDVAMVEVGCWANRHVGIFDGGGWRYGDGKWTANDPAIVTARPLVVIDPEDAEQVERLFRLFWVKNTTGRLTDDLQAALREFARPTPPKPEEPTGLGAVVEDAEGQTWLRDWRGCWRAPDVTARWAKVDAVRVLSPGAES